MRDHCSPRRRRCALAARAVAGLVVAVPIMALALTHAYWGLRKVVSARRSMTPENARQRTDHGPVKGAADAAAIGQPEPARPAASVGAPRLRCASQMTDAEVRDLLSAQDKARTVTPGLQSALTAAIIVAALAAILALGIFNFSHFRAMDVLHGVDAARNPAAGAVDYTAWGVAFIAVVAAAVALAGVRLDVTPPTRNILTTAGSAMMIATGAGFALGLDPSRHDLLKHYHVGVWGTRASFDHLIHMLDACGWLVAACGVAVLVLTVVQRRRIAAAYPE